MSSFSRPTESKVLPWPICPPRSSRRGSGNALCKESSEHPAELLMCNRPRADGPCNTHCKASSAEKWEETEHWDYFRAIAGNAETGEKKNLKKKIREEESLQKAEENLVANTLHGHSALPRPPLFPPGFLREMKAPGIHRSVNRSGQKSKQRSRETRTRNDTLKNQARKFIQP